jgi:hypothetical protein
MPTAPSLERDSAAGRRTSGNEALDRFPNRSLFPRALQQDRSYSIPHPCHLLSIHTDPITRARARARTGGETCPLPAP